MDVIEERLGSWILVKEGEEYYLSVILSIAGAVWPVDFKLNDDEKQQYLETGTDAILTIDKKCCSNRELYCERQVEPEIRRKLSNAFKQHRSQVQNET